MDKYIETLKQYEILNKSAKSGGIVLFGEDWLYDMPIAEITRDNNFDTAVYNRSIKGLCLEDADRVIDICVCALNPSKVFINIGENSIEKREFNLKEFSEKYEWLLYTIHSKCDCDIYILSVINDKHGEANRVLRSVSEKYGCEYIDIQPCYGSFVSFFSKIKLFLRNHPITFCEAMSV